MPTHTGAGLFIRLIDTGSRDYLDRFFGGKAKNTRGIYFKEHCLKPLLKPPVRALWHTKGQVIFGCVCVKGSAMISVVLSLCVALLLSHNEPDFQQRSRVCRSFVLFLSLHLLTLGCSSAPGHACKPPSKQGKVPHGRHIVDIFPKISTLHAHLPRECELKIGTGTEIIFYTVRGCVCVCWREQSVPSAVCPFWTRMRKMRCDW